MHRNITSLANVRAHWCARRLGIALVRQTRPENCVQTVVSMLCQLPVSTVERYARTSGRMTADDALGLLGKLGVYCRPVAATLVADFWPQFYQQAEIRQLRGVGFSLPKGKVEIGHAYLLLGSVIYDPGTGESRRVTETAIRELDWLALMPTSTADSPLLRKLRSDASGVGHVIAPEIAQ